MIPLVAEPPGRRGRFDSLDGLRGLAVLIVFLSHTGNIGAHLLPGADFAGTGKCGVFLFFVLSAFLLTRSFLAAGREAFRRPFLLNYALRRVLRVYPLYALYLLVALVTSLGLWRLRGWPAPVGEPMTLSPADFWRQLTLQRGMDITWSILVEFRYYFLLPLVALAFAAAGRTRFWICILFTVAGVAASRGIWPPSDLLPNDPRLGPYLPVFFLGSLAAVAHLRWRETGWHERAGARWLLEAAGWLALALLVGLIPAVASHLLGHPVPPRTVHRQLLAMGLLWAVVLLACLEGAGGLRRVFAGRALRVVGWISFGVYLWHVTLIKAARSFDWNPALQGWAALGATLVCAALSYRGIERPAMRVRLRPHGETASGTEVKPTGAGGY